MVVMGRAPEGLDCRAKPFATNPLGIPRGARSSAREAATHAVRGGGRPRVPRSRGGLRHPRRHVAALRAARREHQGEDGAAQQRDPSKQAVMAGMGLCFLSLRTVRQELASGHLVVLNVPGPPVVGNWYLTYLESKKLAGGKAFESFLTEQGAELVDAWA